jgi:streptogrisin C
MRRTTPCGGDPFCTGNARCSLGFSVHGGSVTAGHCGSAGATVSGWDGTVIGTFQAPRSPRTATRGSAPGTAGGRSRSSGPGTVSNALVRGSAEAPTGSSVCRSGSTTGWHCGTLLGTNETVQYVGGEVVHELTRTSVCAEPGDSGGPCTTAARARASPPAAGATAPAAAGPGSSRSTRSSRCTG